MSGIPEDVKTTAWAIEADLYQSFRGTAYSMTLTAEAIASAILAERNRASPIVAAAQAVIDAISSDNNGALIGGKWMGGNGGLLSRDTEAKADTLRRELAAYLGK